MEVFALLDLRMRTLNLSYVEIGRDAVGNGFVRTNRTCYTALSLG